MDKPHPLRVATGRFGLGLRGDETVPPGDLRGHIEAQLDLPLPAAGEGLAGTTEQLRRMQERRPIIAARNREKARAAGGEMMAAAPAAMTPEAPDTVPRPVARGDELLAWLGGTVHTPAALPERLAMFWGNHFTVSAVKAKVNLTGGPYLREAIRPNVTGSFHDMLVAAVTHPAMLFYLDNDSSVGPDSRIGQRKKQGLNENLAREVLELHTLGVGGGYTQADVTTFAMVLTGWYVDLDLRSDRCGMTAFDERRHQPGPKKLLGKTYPDSGPDQLMAVLSDLAVHPSTAKHVATRLARSFVAEQPPPRLVEALAASFRNSGGDLKMLARTLVRSEDAWSAPAVKLRSPTEFLLATARLLGEVPKPPPPGVALVAMGQPFITAPSPQGWSDGDDAWATSDGIKTRLDWSQEIAARHAGKLDIAGLVNERLKPMLTDEARTAVLRAETREQALTLLLMSPDFQRR